jgi:hypothetical protein
MRFVNIYLGFQKSGIDHDDEPIDIDVSTVDVAHLLFFSEEKGIKSWLCIVSVLDLKFTLSNLPHESKN